LTEQSARVKRCPAPTAVFTGREAETGQIETCISGINGERRVCVVHGLGGAGKTQLALKAVERTRDKWTFIIYVDASSREVIEITLQDFAKAKEIGETHEDVIEWLESCREQWLMVFDNADDPSVNIRDYFPGGEHGSILVTTRLTDLALLAKGPKSDFHISSMREEEAIVLLIRTARLQDQELSSGEMEAATALLQVRRGASDT
jgi:hypothetical protein